jgi:hypothetical protein
MFEENCVFNSELVYFKTITGWPSKRRVKRNTHLNPILLLKACNKNKI